MNLYLISGLGADERIFKKLEYPAGFKIHYLPWIPNKENEKLADYCRRLAAPINTTQPFVLAGLSFGGICSVEISKFLKPEKLILFSTATKRSELPLTMKLLQHLPFHKVITSPLSLGVSPFVYFMMGVKTAEEKALVNSFAQKTEPEFITWAVDRIAHWDNKVKPTNAVHIHGTADRIFPSHYNKADMRIPGGGHLMVFSKAREVSKALADVLNK